MFNHCLNKNKLILIADSNRQAADAIDRVLANHGYQLRVKIDDGQRIFEVLKPYYSDQDKMGVMIIRDQLPNCNIKQINELFNDAATGLILPMLVIANSEQQSAWARSLEKDDEMLVSVMPDSCSNEQLPLYLDFLFALKGERLARKQQEEKLLTELAGRKVLDTKLKYLVSHDELTGLYNRNSFEKQLSVILNRKTRLPQDGVLMYIDIDRFELINELEGYEAGDNLLIEAAILIRTFINDRDLFARIGSDEFCVFLDNTGLPQAAKTAEQIRIAVEESRFFSRENCYGFTVSIGLASLNSSTKISHASELMLSAYSACKKAKEKGRNLIWLFDHNDETAKEKKNDYLWTPKIKQALSDNLFFLTYQPIIDLATGEIVHYEVLIRLKGDNGSVIFPDQFIAAAERMGLINSIDLWVVENALNTLAAISDNNPSICLAINLSGVAFQDETVLNFVREKLELNWLDPGRLTFEVTETAAIQNFDRTREIINKFRALGCRFALDDFGDGFCSFNYLKNVPVDYVKIDGQFIRNLINDKTDQLLVKSMVEIIKLMDKKVIAEFIDTPLVLSKLQEFGVDYGQGFLLGEPERELKKAQYISMIDFATPIADQ